MAVLGRVLFSSAERVDLPDLLSIDSYAAGDWKYFVQSLTGTTKPYVLYGFDVINPMSAIGTPNCSIRVADSIAYYPGSSAGPFFYGLPSGNPNSAPLVPSLRTNTINYIYLTLTTFNTAQDTRALWDPDRNGGVGGEFTQDVNTESVIQAQVNVSTGSFPANTIPLAIVTMGPTAITAIQDARDMFFRLGTGGLNPNPSSAYTFKSLPSPSYARAEPGTTVANISDPNSFQGGDKNIQTLKEWMDVVMTKLKELGGTTYWYQDTSTFTLTSLFHDALTTTWKSKGKYLHDSSTPGQLTWTEDIYVKSTSSPKDLVIRASGGSPIVIGNEQVAFINLIRNQAINTLDQPVAFTNGQAYVNTVGGSVGLFQNLRKGDWIKKSFDDGVLFLQVREFYNTTQSPGPTTGTSTSAANARSITLSGSYLGATSPSTGDLARYDRGEYVSANGDIQILNRNNTTLTTAGGNLLWLGLRSDTVEAISSISTVSLTGTVTTADGAEATVTSTAHGLVSGDRIVVTTPVAHAGTYSVEVVNANTFLFKTPVTTTGVFSGFYGLATTAATSVNSYLLESANHGFDSGETIVIAGTTGFNGSVTVNVRSATQFQFPIAATHATETIGTATLARMDVRSEEGITKLVQGEIVSIGSGTVDNILSFIGMDSLAETSPVYVIPAGYGTLNEGANYNAGASDSLTLRASKLTAMLADKAQDKTVKYLTSATEALNTTDATPSLQDLSFTPPSSTLTILLPGSSGNAVVTLPSVGAPLQLAINQSAYVVINRNTASTPGIVVSATAAVPVGENVFVIATRLADNYVYLWNGEPTLNNTPLNPSDVPLVQVTRCDPVTTVLPISNPVIVDGISVQAGDTVLFTALSSNSNEIYQAVGTGTNITSWSALYKFHSSQIPVLGDTVLILNGSAFALQTGTFDGAAWNFNNKVRYFNGANYWEQSNIVNAALVDNTTMANVFSTAWSGNEHMVIDYSIVRSTARETGTLHVVTDGAVVSVNTEASYINGSSGISFTGSISGSNLLLQYSSTSTGQAGTMKYMVRRWSSGNGGPGGLPSYSGSASAPTAAGGSVNSIQFNSGGSLAGNANFAIDVTDLSINLNGLREGILSSSIAVLNNQAVFTNLFSMANTYPFIVISYSLTKEGFARTGQLLVSYDGTNVACNDSFVETGATGVLLQAIVSGSNIQFQYTSTNGVSVGALKYSYRKWS